MVNEARELASYITEPTGSNIYSPTGWISRKITQTTDSTTTYNSTEGYEVFNDINAHAFKPTTSGAILKGARIYLKNGLYRLDDQLWWSNDTDADNVKLYVEGETRDGCIIRNELNDAVNNKTMFGSFCSADVANLTFDGDGLGIKTTMFAAIANNSGNKKYLRANNVHFTKHTGFGMRVSDSDDWQMASSVNCWYDAPAAFEDRCSLHANEFVLIDGNYFDRTNGSFTGDGQCITGGDNGGRMQITNNVIKHLSTTNSRGISIEPFGDLYNIYIHDNILEYAKIGVGKSGSWAHLIHDLSIKNNQLMGNGIDVAGPSSGSFSTQMKYIWIEGNVIKDAYSTGIKLEKLAGFTSCRYNKVVNANTSLSTGNFGGLIWALNCTNLSLEYNLLEMNDKAPADALYSKYGIRYESLTDSRVKRNTVLNKTTQGQLAYVSAGSHSGVNKFSQDVW